MPVGKVVVQTDSVGRWAVLVEPNGFVSTETTIIAPLSSKGSALSVYWNVNAMMLVTYAERGRIIRQFDPLLLTGRGDQLPEERNLPWGHPGSPRAAMLALVQRVTGVTVTPDWLFAKRRRTLHLTTR